MNKKSLFVCSLLLLPVISGCTSLPKLDKVSSDLLPIKTISSKKGTLEDIEVFWKNGDLLIHGTVLKNSIYRILNGHVHLNLLNKDNSLIESRVSNYRFRVGGGRSAKSTKFSAQLRSPIPDDGSLSIEHHDADHSHQNDGTLSIM